MLSNWQNSSLSKRLVTWFEMKMTNDNQFTQVIQSIICHVLRNTPISTTYFIIIFRYFLFQTHFFIGLIFHTCGAIDTLPRLRLWVRVLFSLHPYAFMNCYLFGNIFLSKLTWQIRSIFNSIQIRNYTVLLLNDKDAHGVIFESFQ